MRGAHLLAALLWIDPGIIPADAGSTALGGDPVAEAEDHPRGCGEHIATARYVLHVQGSSPRMRGAPITSSIR